MTLWLGLRRLGKVLLREASVPLRRAWYASRLHTAWAHPALDIRPDDGLGDTLILTPALRELKRVNPDCYVRFYTNFPTLVRDLSYIDEVLPYDAAPVNSLRGDYGQLLSHGMHLFRISGRRRVIKLPVPLAQAHLARLTGCILGVKPQDVRPDCVIRRSLVNRWRQEWQSLPRPRIVMNRNSSGSPPNKDWPGEYWNRLIDRLEPYAGVIDVGVDNPTQTDARSPNYLDLRGRTTIDEFVAAIAAADMHVGPISGPVHVAAAAGTPSVVIYGGAEHPSNTAYPNNVALYTGLNCAPCWLTDPCPYGLKCMIAISPETVENAVWSIWQKRTRACPIEDALCT